MLATRAIGFTTPMLATLAAEPSIRITSSSLVVFQLQAGTERSTWAALVKVRCVNAAVIPSRS